MVAGWRHRTRKTHLNCWTIELLQVRFASLQRWTNFNFDRVRMFKTCAPLTMLDAWQPLQFKLEEFSGISTVWDWVCFNKYLFAQWFDLANALLEVLYMENSGLVEWVDLGDAIIVFWIQRRGFSAFDTFFFIKSWRNQRRFSSVCFFTRDLTYKSDRQCGCS